MLDPEMRANQSASGGAAAADFDWSMVAAATTTALAVLGSAKERGGLATGLAGALKPRLNER
jgi:hypothetical protein